ncbi:NADPH:quinone oxidoreductase family protein [Conexibacter sp. SYSU D00693]|uniref:quinone oxidoreductase family protein n=1 Tax=Conexibacter sp. SYSU D00693 TaxID=2812560 RepID=UPI00196ADF46|nr:NADPH:quinone oxidoreductase family protein [Conexibacter sp. SYSU D00693]
MRAIQQTEFGGPEVLQLVDVPTPEPADGEVLIKVTTAGLNFADTHAREDSYLAKQTLPLIPGSEVVGVREDTGQRVVALCGTGGYAEYATAPESLTFPVADGVDDATALAMVIQGLTAWHLHATCARVRPGESVVVVSGAGGTGSLAIQLGRAFGAGRVIATASTPEKRELCLELGADAAVDAHPEGLGERLVEANLGERVDVVLEMAGGKVFEECLTALAPFGRMVAYGIASREQNELRTGALMRRSHAVVGFWLNHTLDRPAMVDEALHGLFEKVRSGELKPLRGASYPLEEARQAQIDLGGRRTTGKVVLRVAD